MINSVYSFLRDIVKHKSVLFELVKRDVQQQYVGSLLGGLWLVLQPLLFIGVLYAVFSLGFRSSLDLNMPFSIYLVTGIVAWNHFATNFSSTASSIRDYSFLVKKVDFRLSMLPIVKMSSSLLAHVFLVIVAILLAWYEGFSPSIYTVQILYYVFCMSALLLGLGWLTSSTNIFVRDVSKVVTVLIQFGFWLTPVFWNINMVPERFRWIIDLNPMFYIITGYRDSIVSRIPFWEREGGVYFWVFTLVFLYIGITVYRKLRPHFAEVI